MATEEQKSNAATGATLAASAIGGIGSIAAAFISSMGSSGFTKVKTMNREQQVIFTLLVSDALGIDPSLLAENKRNIQWLLQSGELDHVFDIAKDSEQVQEHVFQGDRVAGLTESQQDIISGVMGSDLRGLDARSAFADLREERGLGPQRLTDQRNVADPTFDGIEPTVGTPAPPLGDDVQVVGEDGPEVIEADEDLDIIPAEDADSFLSRLTQKRDLRRAKILTQADKSIARKATTQAKREARAVKVIDREAQKRELLGNTTTPTVPDVGTLPPASTEGALAQNNMGIVGEFNPLATESNAINADPDDLLRRTGLQGLADGGALNEDEKAVVGENGPELAVPKGSLQSNIQSASQRALSGQPSSTINDQTTSDFIQKNIVNPANQQFQENTLPSISASVAGAGFLGSQRAKATQRASDLSNRNITEASSSLRFQDEQARRDLAEKAANRSANFVPTALNVENNPLAQQQQQANIEATRSGTSRQDALLGGEIGQQQANIGATQAGTAAQQFETGKGQALLPYDLANASVSIDQALANVDITDANSLRLKTAAERDVAETGRISAETEAQFREGGLTDLEIEKLNADITNANADFIAKEQDAVSAQNKETLDTWERMLKFANVEQSQNQLELNAIMQKFLDEEIVAADLWRKLTSLVGETTTAIAPN